jgi:RNA polymerase sigma-70 factor, ECF subfamily
MTNATNPSGDARSEPSSVSSTLLDQIRRRRPEAWRRLIDLYGPVVYRWCRQLGVARADAPDVVQDVFASVAAVAERFRRDRPGDSFGAWLRTIARNKVCDHFRRRRGQLSAEGGTEAQQRWLQVPEASAESQSAAGPLDLDSRFLHRTLDLVRCEFEPGTWDVFWRLVVDGQTPGEVAEALSLSLPAVYQAKSRVLRRLRREWNEAAE